MIDPIMTDIQPLIGAEAARAKLIHGEHYASLHEGFGVLAEEVQEGQEEAESVSGCLSELLYAIRIDDRAQILNEIRRT